MVHLHLDRSKFNLVSTTRKRSSLHTPHIIHTYLPTSLQVNHIPINMQMAKAILLRLNDLAVWPLRSPIVT